MIRQKNGTWKLSDEEMNLLSIYAYETMNHLNNTGSYARAEEAREIHNTIYGILEKAGFYKN